MNSNTIGNILTLTTFGESHGVAIGGVFDGCPSNLKLDFDFIQSELRRRSTAQDNNDSQRKETDEIEFLSGILDGITLGTPIAFIVRNHDCRTADYETLKDIYRPSHADYTYQQKYGIRDWRGGGRASARCTLPIVVAGAIAKQLIGKENIRITAEIDAIGDKEEARRSGDSIGAIVKCTINNMPVGLGAPIFHKLQADLAHAIFSIPAVKGFEYGDGFAAAHMKGSECNDAFICKDGEIRTATNHSGGIQGGISNGEDIIFKVAFKPIPSIAMEQQTVNEKGEERTLFINGRHDVCAAPRAMVLVEALAAIVVADHFLLAKTNRF